MPIYCRRRLRICRQLDCCRRVASTAASLWMPAGRRRAASCQRVALVDALVPAGRFIRAKAQALSLVSSLVVTLGSFSEIFRVNGLAKQPKTMVCARSKRSQMHQNFNRVLVSRPNS